ncbi:MAG: DUF4062 domain-containing protein [Muribaculaceae bacterium]|nr:DUF4062 domain-containing protein [Muribaculaceae bacterium]
MFQANVYKIMVGAPSDVESEVEASFNVIQRWNYIHAEKNNIVLLPSHWSLNAYPTLNEKAQKAIDKQLVEKSDMLICIFGSKIGTPTDNYISGTVEEIEEHLKEGKHVMAFFSKNINTSKTTTEQITKLLSFREDMFSRGLCAEYDNIEDLKIKLTEKLSLFVNDNFLGLDLDETGINQIAGLKESYPKFSDEGVYGENILSKNLGNMVADHSKSYGLYAQTTSFQNLRVRIENKSNSPYENAWLYGIGQVQGWLPSEYNVNQNSVFQDFMLPQSTSGFLKLFFNGIGSAKITVTLNDKDLILEKEITWG